MHGSSELRQLARACGVETSYTDISGVVQRASDEGLIAVLGALGTAIRSEADVARATAEVQRARWARPLEPVCVAWDGMGRTLLRLRGSDTGRRYALRVACESGATLTQEGDLDALDLDETVNVEGIEYRALQLPLPGPLAAGYHRLWVEFTGHPPISSLVLSAPSRVFNTVGADKRQAWGVFVPLHALRSERSLGAADFSDLRTVSDWLAERGGGVVGTLPLLATFLDRPFVPSPYAPVSRLAWNELYLDIRALPEYATSVAAQRRLTATGERAALEGLRAADHVDFAAVYAGQRDALHELAKDLWARGGRRLDAVHAFESARPELVDYARFRAAIRQGGGTSWHLWPPAARAGTLAPNDFDQADYREQIYAQFAVDEQLQALATSSRERGLGLYLDFPVGVHPDGFDAWRHRAAFAPGLSTGAPPDGLFAGGQDWGFAPLHPDHIRDQEYAYVIAAIRSHLRYAGVLRIDHVMGLHRLYAVPHGCSAEQGVYVRYNAAELYAILSIESHRARALLLGENLGTVPPEVTAKMGEHGIHGMHVVQYSVDPAANPALPEVAERDVASLNTHDMPTFRAFWEATDVDLRGELGWLAPEQAAREKHEREALRRAIANDLRRRGALYADEDAQAVLEGLLQYLGRSDACLVLVTLEDLWGETHPQNVPGTLDEHANWTHRTRYTFERWRELPGVLTALESLDQARRGARSRGQMRHAIANLDATDIEAIEHGNHSRLHQVLGAHPRVVDGHPGTQFRVRAPHAQALAVVGDFNRWQPERGPLVQRTPTGVWEGFVVGVGPADRYAFHVTGPRDARVVSDPLAFSHDPIGETAVVAEHRHNFADKHWMAERAASIAAETPLLVYELHLGSWRRVPEQANRVLTYRELAPLVCEHVNSLGFTHVQLLGLLEPADASAPEGDAKGWFAPTARHGPPSEFMAFVDHLHAANLGVFVDWPAAQRSSVGAQREPLSPAAVHDWDFLGSSAHFWVDRFHIDGLHIRGIDRILDPALAHDEPRASAESPARVREPPPQSGATFVRSLSETLRREHSGATLSVSSAAPYPGVTHPSDRGGLGCSHRWNDHLTRRLLRLFEPHASQWLASHADLRGHDHAAEHEIVAFSHERMSAAGGSWLSQAAGDPVARLADLRSLLGLGFAYPGKTLLFMGTEFGQRDAWHRDRSLDWHLLGDPAHAGVRTWVRDLARAIRQQPPLYELDDDAEGLRWLDDLDPQTRCLGWLRIDRGGAPVLVAANLGEHDTHQHLRVPRGGAWIEFLNSNALDYGGTGSGNAGAVVATAHGDIPHRLELLLPARSVLFLRPDDPR